ncbi:Hypothetical protein GLP15_1504 [Giardia lamblia P15]|uniref:NAD(P)-binding domain-containing protein n=1 Tax=Giardia intestinalis (strain P15) TaxID=658858 RepID=E1EYN6_GIAIA|nr:Hypothetical protein GLP15_1504 [Giardia lamblia P15]
MSLFVLVLGANGTLGVAVVHKLLLERFSVHAQVRDRTDAGPLAVLFGDTVGASAPTATCHKGLRIVRGDPSTDQFWLTYKCLLDELGIACLSLDEAEARYAASSRPLPIQQHGKGILVATVICTGTLVCRSVEETTPRDILDAISAHVLPVQQSFRYLPTFSGNRYCCYVAVGSDPLSWEGTIDCCPYCVAKFALRDLMDCARHDLPHAHVEEVYPGNFLSGLWEKSGIDCPLVETTAEQVAEDIFNIVDAQLAKVRTRLALSNTPRV